MAEMRITNLVDYSCENQIATLILNRPERLNAFSDDLVRHLADALRRFDLDPEAQVAVICGNGRAFSSGADVHQRQLPKREEFEQHGGPQGWGANSGDLLTRSVNWKPVIAAPHGYAMGLALGNDGARQLLRYTAGEENRFFFENWELAQIVLGVLLTGLLIFGVESRMLAGFSGAMLILTIFEHLKITPEMAWLGRSFDFLPWTAESLSRDQFWKLHGAYSAIEIVKMLLAVVIAGFLFQMRPRRAKQRVQIKAVDDTHHRHVNG